MNLVSKARQHQFLSPIEEVIEDARNGRMFILVDAEERENEGDLVIPAQMATPDAIKFMAKHRRGLICLARKRKSCAAAATFQHDGQITQNLSSPSRKNIPLSFSPKSTA